MDRYHRCNLICIFDQECDYIVALDPCHFGSFSYSGQPASGPTEVQIRFKASGNDTTIEDEKFEPQSNTGLSLSIFKLFSKNNLQSVRYTNGNQY